jgi:hypothetical protein
VTIAGVSATVEVEWALWGKEARDREYRLLRCSTGTFHSPDFTFVIDRYSPGTLDQLPQVTISWLPHPETGAPSHLAVAIHETAADDDPRGAASRDRYDAVGREITFVRYFCVPYDVLAQQAISYQAVYDRLRRHPLPDDGREPVNVDLGIPPAPRVSASQREFAALVAAQLLTTRPVCILGADQIRLEDRLRFIDLVMSMLPYGARSRLSAATWVNSNSTGHKMRLFFAAAAREDTDGYGTSRRLPDIAVQWGRPDSVQVTDAEALDYLNWPGFGRSWAPARLAKSTTPRDLRDKASIREMIRELSLGRLDSLPVAEILACLGEDLRYGVDSDVRLYIESLQRKSTQRRPAQERREYRALIKHYGLLAGTPQAGPWQDHLYRALLALAFDSPLTYMSYLQIEDCLGSSLQDHHALLALLKEQPAKIDGSWLLVRRGLGYDLDSLLSALWTNGVVPSDLIMVLAKDASPGEPALHPEHGRLMIDPALQYMLRYGDNGRAQFRKIGYLAPALDHYFPGDEAAQVKRLILILRNTHGNNLSKRDIKDIFSTPGYPPSDALLGAVIGLAPNHGDYAKIAYGTARTAKIVGPTVSRKRRKVPAGPATTRRQPGARRAPQRARPAQGTLTRLRVNPKAVVLAFGLLVIVVLIVIIYVVQGKLLH